jgi:hypothetical protein
MGVQDFNDWFCIPAFFVLFRETLEAAVLVAVLIQYLNRANAKHLKRQVSLAPPSAARPPSPSASSSSPSTTRRSRR